jgi:hypothetical protein
MTGPSSWSDTMTTDRSATLDEAERAAVRATRSGLADGLIEQMARWVGGRAGVQAVFGEPVRSGDTVVIPVARSRWAFGGGAGGGETEADPGSPALAGSGYGSGGGGGVITDPVGYLEIRPERAVFRPIGHRVGPGTILALGLAVALAMRALGRIARS